MPYGFIKYIEDKGYSPETVKSYEKVIRQFFSFLESTYPNSKEPFQITSSDIKKYLANQGNRGKSVSTINKELAILKTLFHYFWENDKVAVDPAVKIKRLKVTHTPQAEITYEEILDILERVLKNDKYPKVRKALFILASKGLKTSQFRFKKDDVTDHTETEKIEIMLKNRILTLEGPEASHFQEYFYETVFNGSEYVFSTKTHGMDYGGPIQVMSILSHLRAISREYLAEGREPLTLVAIRRALLIYLYKKKTPIQVIAHELGIEEISASNYLKQILGTKMA
ncbi:tyrosine-type recombinase/integrase [Peribacillus sp. SCS-26]|uniref:tyrosine-type recombinase/integrase n=1 Tax=Paraperibacillus marinus TaxID=3115295 RepID=UPI0039064BA8